MYGYVAASTGSAVVWSTKLYVILYPLCCMNGIQIERWYALAIPLYLHSAYNTLQLRNP